ncbi:peptidoglycan DD-metalloendopeptidase family protein [Niveispirillum irakense]|uniref:peptidoglycan DD-metalloendopeptidase family protein n=1 Tax=Niveispirillum irakense TaxID=34011 RepID=UPI00041189D3|nr:peptidoglycan DD-metalloendopeptidase family protein [Niveispirillum irakense]
MRGFFTRSERVIIVDDDCVRAVTIGPGERLRPKLYVGLALCGMVLACVGWAVTAVNLSDKSQSIAAVEQGTQPLAQQLDESREQLSRVAAELEQARSTLATALAEEEETQARLDAALAVLAEAEKPGAKPLRQILAAARTELLPLKIGMDEGGSHLRAAEQSLVSVTEMSQEFAARRAQAAAAALAMVATELDSDTDPASLPRLMLATDGLGQALAEAQAEAARKAALADAAQRERDDYAARMAAAEQRMTDVAAGQVALLSRLSQHAGLRIGAIEDELKSTGIDLDKALRQVADARRSVGGPLVDLPELPQGGLPPEAVAALTQLESLLERQARLRALNNYLPLTPPVDNFYVSSGFGSRRDPFTNGWASHTGLDLVAREGSPITLPAAGTVVDVTYDEGYGRMVEVDHGFGIRTRYAHLAKAMVKPGEKLEPGNTIGLLGNSGRSSGPHLHYEVLLEGRPVDPLRFMEKSRHVCEG